DQAPYRWLNSCRSQLTPSASCIDHRAVAPQWQEQQPARRPRLGYRAGVHVPSRGWTEGSADT
ncbi:hypothetical protein BaRGS_00032297, partial [Batillaria attramentaria]